MSRYLITCLFILISQSAYVQNGETLRRITLSAPEMELINDDILDDVIIPLSHYADSVRTDKSMYQKFVMEIGSGIDSLYDNKFVWAVHCVRFDGNIIRVTNPVIAKGIYIYQRNLFILEGNLTEKYFRRKSRKLSVTFYQNDEYNEYAWGWPCDWFIFLGIDGVLFPWESNVPHFSHHEL